jgi:hypothetical protein
MALSGQISLMINGDALDLPVTGDTYGQSQAAA